MLCQAYVVSWQSFMHLRLCVHSPVFCSAQISDCRMHCSFGSLQKCCCRSAPMVRVELQNSVRGTDRSRNRCQVSSLTYSLTQAFYRLLQYCESLPGLSSIHLHCTNMWHTGGTHTLVRAPCFWFVIGADSEFRASVCQYTSAKSCKCLTSVFTHTAEPDTMRASFHNMLYPCNNYCDPHCARPSCCKLLPT